VTSSRAGAGALAHSSITGRGPNRWHRSLVRCKLCGWWCMTIRQLVVDCKQRVCGLPGSIEVWQSDLCGKTPSPATQPSTVRPWRTPTRPCSLALGVVYCHMICPSCISLTLPVDCRSIMYIGCLLFDVALCMHVLASPRSGSQEICRFTLTLAARVTTVPSRYAHTSACSTRNRQAAVGSRSPKAAVVMG
jgi:hypothetical protein